MLSHEFDYIVIGSGFGGSVSALRLSEKGYRVAVLERGKRFSPGDYAKSNWNIFRFLWMPILRCFGIQNLSLFNDALILSGSGVGGGSLVYANTLLEPSDQFYDAPNWKHLANWKEELAPHYQTARQFLGVATNPVLTQVDQTLKAVAQDMGKGNTFSATEVGVFFGSGKPSDQGKLFPDPYFNGEGPARRACNFCGGCMVGCRFDAKNTLDKNYLYLAEKLGTHVIPEAQVEYVKPLGDNGSKGYEIHYKQSTAYFNFLRPTKIIKAKGVVFSAGVLGTLRLLFRCRDQYKTMPKISSMLGRNVRTNSEALLGVTMRGAQPTFDSSKGVAISSGFQADDHTYIEPVRYSKGSSFMRMLAVPMVDGNPGSQKESVVLRGIKIVLTILKNPFDTLRLILPGKWAERTIIFLVMQTLDNKMDFQWGKGFLTGFLPGLRSKQRPEERLPSYIPIGHEVARRYAEKINGIPQSAVNEVTLQIPTTAHILGGCGIGASPQTGVIDINHKLFGYENAYVCDGSVIPANLGVNPSLTITAMTERCWSRVPRR